MENEDFFYHVLKEKDFQYLEKLEKNLKSELDREIYFFDKSLYESKKQKIELVQKVIQDKKQKPAFRKFNDDEIKTIINILEDAYNKPPVIEHVVGDQLTDQDCKILNQAKDLFIKLGINQEVVKTIIDFLK